MPKAIRMHQTGSPEVLAWEDIEVGDPGPGEVRVRHTAVGLNFIDCYFRSGTYAPPSLPLVPGFEAAGVVEAVGEGVDAVKAGDRVAYATAPIGAYAEARLVPADSLVALPADLNDADAAAVMLKGLTAHYLLRRTFEVKTGQTILVHAAAGGVGLIACQWAKHLGATVIGTVGTAAKADAASAAGCDHTIVTADEDFVARVADITGGAGVPVVYDSVGRATFAGSLDCLAPLGTMVLLGQSSGVVEPIDPGVLAAKGSLYLTRPTLFTYTATPQALAAAATELFAVVGSGAVKIAINQTYPLSEAASAHADLEARRTTGSTVLLP